MLGFKDFHFFQLKSVNAVKSRVQNMLFQFATPFPIQRIYIFSIRNNLMELFDWAIFSKQFYVSLG